MLTITNSQFTATINPLGAELTTLTRNADGRNYIWADADGRYWSRHAPILFPSIGRSNSDEYVLDGQTYPMRQHGFARDFTFDTITPNAADSVNLTLHATPETKQLFPFDFALTITYTLTATGLQVEATVTNRNAVPARKMPFALGFHPGFALTQPLDHYTVTLNGATTPVEAFGIGPVPFRDETLAPLAAAAGTTIPLSYALLDDGLVILDARTATSATLATADGSHTVTIDLADFPYLTLWSPEHKQAPFICVEPFDGLPDQAGHPSNWLQKAGNTVLKGGDHKTVGFTLTLA
ncbi:aldose 1-epimerase family protein [Lacticaseibacillus daqingensis]|uniref:aldose 1-epimerase family protein n=1 Tax=Lacticaseibacillus daqingensis TaxID=2486014 RepID=UPI000F7B4081|nr:aldose 1-epimerase family protein [Lacticaseibacillus daqingensis]